MHEFFVNLPFLIILISFLAALWLLSKSADYLTENAIELSEILGVPEMIIGATIVSIGTTLPEFSTSLVAIANHATELALGNSLGSVMTNGGLILGISSLYGSIPVSKKSRLAVWSIIGGMLMIVLVLLPQLSAKSLILPSWLGIGFLIFLPLYLFRSFRTPKAPASPNLTVEKTPSSAKRSKHSTSQLIIKILVAALIVTFSSTILVQTVQVTAERFNVSATIISATIVALGTSLPELSTSVSAARKEYGSLAFGNLMGASLMNVFLVLGTAMAFSKPAITVPLQFLEFHLPLILITFAYIIIAIYNTKKFELTKKEGILFLFIYLVYLLINIFG